MNTFTRIAADWIRQQQAETTLQAEFVLPADEPGAWLDSFDSWVTAACCFRDRCFGGIGPLHIHFCEWAVTHDDVPCTRLTFESLLAGAGFVYADGMVYGLILSEDAAWQVFLKPMGEQHEQEKYRR